MTLKIRDLLECEIPCGHPEPPPIVEATPGMTLQRPPYDPPAGATLKSAGKKQGRGGWDKKQGGVFQMVLDRRQLPLAAAATML